jgi:serine/threonine-protein kinase
VTSTYGVPQGVNLQGVTSQFQVAAPVRAALWKHPVALITTLVVLAAAGIASFQLLGKPTASAALADGLDPASVGVLYFQDQSPDSSLRFVADGLTDGLISTLSQVQGLSVISRAGVEQFRGTSLGLDSVAKVLGSGTLVRGAVEPDGSNLRVQVTLIDQSGTDFDRAAFTLPATELTRVRDSLASEVARLIRLRLGTEVRLREQRAGTSSPQAWSLVQRAEQLHRRGEAAAGSGDLAGMDQQFAAADSLLRAAAAVDAQWDEPVIARANLVYRRTRLIRRDPVVIKPLIDSGLALVDQALALNAENADALELRGNLRYWGWLLNIEPDDAKAQANLLAARADFEKATTVNPRQAGAWASLSHLYYQTSSGVDINLAARRALEADAFLSNANVVIDRLFLSSYDLGQFSDAERWCSESQRRFPTRFESVKCQLQLLTTRAKEPDVALAWTLADSMVALTPEQRRPLQRLHANMWTAAVLARAKLPDSARNLVRRSLGDADIDPSRDLAYTGAFVYATLGDKANAIELLKTYISANARRRRTLAEDPGWWFRGLQDDPAFRQLVGPS